MVKHMIVWSLKDGIDKDAVKAEIKKQLEDLTGKIDGLLEMKIITNGLDSSKGDLFMDSTFESVEALKVYAVHPLHVAVADGIVRPNTASRASYDYEI
ncbi:MAG: Dabb family protein [Clostridia bacterium]|nr:Dabb family protein [Clostridia bacterium]